MKIFLQLLLILVIVATISICAIQPDMHKNVIVYDSDYTLVTEQEVKEETKTIPIAEKSSEPVKTVTKVENTVQQKNNDIDFKKIVSNVETISVPVVQTKKTEVNTVSAPKKTTNTTQVTATVKKPVEKQIKNTESTQTTVKNEVKQPVKVTEPIKTEVKNEVNTLTPQEETIAWNTWRSNLQNQIMKDVRLPYIPNGTIFQFSFTVDKYGKITNVHTGANPSNYTPYAIQYIAPVIRSYQGRSILNFPEGTARTTTEVTGKWKISDKTKLSTPQDFNDIEKVTK